MRIIAERAHAAIADFNYAVGPDDATHREGLVALHPVDPRRQPLLAAVEAAREEGDVDGRYLDIAVEIERAAGCWK